MFLADALSIGKEIVVRKGSVKFRLRHKYGHLKKV
jgi:hypothetical protein